MYVPIAIGSIGGNTPRECNGDCPLQSPVCVTGAYVVGF